MSIITCSLDPHEDLLLFSPFAESLEGAENLEDGRKKEDQQGDMDVEKEEQGEGVESRIKGSKTGKKGKERSSRRKIATTALEETIKYVLLSLRIVMP